MRDIRFRAWEVNRKAMIDLHKLTPLATTVEHDGLYLPFVDNLVLMQYTGLKDKNGREIYEGDIISTGHINWQILWDIRSAQFAPHTIEDITTSDHISSGVWPMRNWNWLDVGKAINLQKVGSMGKVVEVEVIGNIYENPELLRH